MARLFKKYSEEARDKLKEEFKYSSSMQIPKLEKIVLNCGVGEAVGNAKIMEYIEYALTQISGQKPVVTKAKKSIAGFKLRQGMPIGCMVTLRGARMYEFLDRLIAIALPRVRDFRGTPTKGFDGSGNDTLGVKENIVFPEINIDKLDRVRGLSICFVTSAVNDEEGKRLLELLGMPFRRSGKVEPQRAAA